MQTLEATRDLCEVDKDLLRQRVKTFLKQLDVGDIAGFVQLVAHDVVCFPASTWRDARYPRPIRGRDAMAEAFRHRTTKYVSLGSTLHRVLVDSDQAVVHRTTRIRERGGGAEHAFDCVNLFRFRDGLIVEFSELPDGSAYEAVINFPH